jgi:hypothetical protein
MMIATGVVETLARLACFFAVLAAIEVFPPQKEAADYREGRSPGKVIEWGRPLFSVHAADATASLRDDVGGQLVLDEGDAVAQDQLALLEPLNLKEIGTRRHGERLDGGVEVAMLLLQARKLRAKFTLFVVCHGRGTEIRFIRFGWFIPGGSKYQALGASADFHKNQPNSLFARKL